MVRFDDINNLPGMRDGIRRGDIKKANPEDISTEIDEEAFKRPPTKNEISME